MMRKKRQIGWVSYIRGYLGITQSKIIVWGFFLVPYVLVIILYSGVLPAFVQTQVKEAIVSSDLISLFGTTQVIPNNTDPEMLTIGYFLVTYLWSCILVENFGTMRYCLRHRRWENRNNHGK